MRASTATASPRPTPRASSACASASTRSAASCQETGVQPDSRSSRYAGVVRPLSSANCQSSGSVRLRVKSAALTGAGDVVAIRRSSYAGREGAAGGEQAWSLYTFGPMRTIWNGSISFGLVNIPIGLALATQRNDVSFRTLHRECRTPIKQKRWCPVHERDVEPDELVKGWEFAKGQFVLVEESDLESVALQRSQSIEILRFVALAEVDPVYFDRTYYLAPVAAEAQRRPYVLLLRAMQESGTAAVGKFVLWGKENLCLIRAQDDALVLETLFFADDVRSKEEIEESVGATEVREPELALAGQVIQSLVGAWSPADFENDYRRDLNAMLEAKLAGEEVVRPEPAAETPVVDLMEALRRSVADVQSRRGSGKRRRRNGESRLQGRLSHSQGAGAQERLTPETVAA